MAKKVKPSIRAAAMIMFTPILTAGLGLAGDALDGRAADLTDAPAAAEDGDPHADAGPGDRQATVTDRGGGLRQESGNHCGTPPG